MIGALAAAIFAPLVAPKDGLAASPSQPDMRRSDGGALPRVADLDQRFTFEHFVVGNSNRFAHAGCQAVAEAPGLAYNPLYAYGSAGLGKTHLMHAIGNYVRERNPKADIVYVPSARYAAEHDIAIEHHRFPEFSDRYRRADVVLIDDVQALEGNEPAQRELAQMFLVRHDAQKQVVFAGDRPPTALPLHRRARSLVEWGLVTDLYAPDFLTRVKILRTKSAAEGIAVPSDVLAVVAEAKTANIRELENALISIVAFASLIQASITLDLATEVLDVIADRLTPLGA